MAKLQGCAIRSAFFYRTKPISRKSFIFMVSSAVSCISNRAAGEFSKEAKFGWRARFLLLTE
jgi:hypothetical protein